jgi:tetratricopeptide (TPR) repeat protein
VASIQTPGFSQAKKSEADKAARRILDSARRSYRSGQFDVAAQRFGEFLRNNPKHAETPSASYGLGLSQLKLRKHANLAAAVTAFRMPSGRMEFTDRPLAIYYLGVSLRDLATSTLAQKVPSGSSDSRATYAKQYREEAARSFASAVDAFTARSSKTPPPAAPAVHPDLLRAARARSDQADVLLRLRQYKQAIVLSKATLSDKSTVKQFGDRALYNMGYAHFAMKNYLAAGRALGKLAPFKQDFGPHARYLLARTHHLSGAMPEAAGAYKAVLKDYTARKAAATEAARRSYRSIPADQRAAAAALVAGPPAPFIVRTMFYSALLQAEGGRFANALTGFTAFITQAPKHPLAPEAQLRQGYCHLQLRSYAEAIKTLDPLRKHPKLADRASWWKARARVGSANPEVPQTYAQTLATAITELTAAAASAHSSSSRDPKAHALERDILMELGDVQQLLGKYKEAVATYGKILQYSSYRAEEAMQRLATAYHLGGDYSRSDSVCSDFEKKFPKSTLLPAIWFRRAENACMLAVHSKPTSYSSSRETIERTFKQAVNRYERLLDKFPDFSKAHLARYGLATAQYRLGWYIEAIETLSAIPAADHVGRLGAVPYLTADCHIRTFPTSTDNALTAAKLMDKAVKAGKLLEGFVSAQAKSPKIPDALLKLGYCYQRLGSILADPTAKKVAYTKGKDAYGRLIKGYSKDPTLPTAILEQAKCMVLLGDSPGALNQLGSFQRDPYRADPVAPLAIVQLSNLLRTSKRAIDAVRIVKECRERHEKNMSRDPLRSSWIPGLQYEHGLAIMDTGNLAEARAVFEALAKKYPGRPEAANSLWRTGQCQRRELIAALAAAEKLAVQPNAPADQVSAAGKAVSQALTGVGTVAAQLTTQAKTLAKTAKGSKGHLRLIYEAAWCYRILGEREIDRARRKLQQDAMRVSRSRRSSSSGGGTPKALSPPRISLEDLPVQESEAHAIKLYEELIAAAPQSPLAARGRFELAEMFAHRRRNDPAVELLETILENSPPADLAQLARLRLAACLLDRGDPKRAMALVKLVAGKAKGNELGHVRYLTGEAYILQKEWSKAIEQLAAFRDTDPYRRMPGISDRALLRLARAYEQTGNWGESRRAMETLASYHPRSPWINEARFGVARARENTKDYTNALAGYASVTANTATGVAARAQLRIGHCLMALKKFADAAKAFLAVPYTYNYPEYNAEAWYESGLAYAAAKQPAEAAKSLGQVIKEHPKSKWAEEAKKQLPAIKEQLAALKNAKKKT